MVNQRTQGENKMGARYTRDKLQQAAKDNTGGGTGAGFNWVDLKVDKNTPTKQVTVNRIPFWLS